MNILVTGGAGYIGSHTCVALLEAGYRVVVLDNLSNSCAESLSRVRAITGKELVFEKTDLCDEAALTDCFSKYKFEGVIHFAGLKSVSESLQLPLQYYHNNLLSTLNLCRAMARFRVAKLIFSSSATVYGVPEMMPVNENCATSATNPYGRSKLMIEEMLADWVNASLASFEKGEADICPEVVLLRYFNPVGAHESGLIGENPLGIPNNLVPYMVQVAAGKHGKLNIYGNDYPTRDGTGVRDYIHVCDLAQGHLAALQWLVDRKAKGPLIDVFNLGTGRGCSVLELLDCFETVSGVKVPCQIVGRREGDVAECYADIQKARDILGWVAEKSINEMMVDTWRWQKNNPEGY
ncbi:MAG: UDP-glucose 4-epimerase GalE [Pseudomonadales bacterium]|nr:UDP-glucose 4-epimerase GalE [Pseudomonadales bacterium]